MNSRVLVLQHHNQQAWVYPEQGFQLYGFEQDFGEHGIASVIYGSDNKIEPPKRRYGNPILFPNPSVCWSDQGPNSWRWKNSVLDMPFHGFARNFYWQVLDVQSNQVTGELVPNSNSTVAFPFDFRLRLIYRLEERGLVLNGEIQNGGQEAFPYALGFHPYLRSPLGSKGTIADCSVQLPNAQEVRSDDSWKSQNKIPFAARRICANDELGGSILLTDTKSNFLELEDRANQFIARVSVEKSERPLPVWVVWSESPQSPYVCLEPWSDTPNALNRHETLVCSPGETHRYQMILSVRFIG